MALYYLLLSNWRIRYGHGDYSFRHKLNKDFEIDFFFKCSKYKGNVIVVVLVVRLRHSLYLILTAPQMFLSLCFHFSYFIFKVISLFFWYKFDTLHWKVKSNSYLAIQRKQREERMFYQLLFMWCPFSLNSLFHFEKSSNMYFLIKQKMKKVQVQLRSNF